MSPEIAATIDSIEVNLNAGGMNTINIILAFVMYGVALGIKPGIFIEVFKKPKSVILGAVCQLILLPAFTCLLAILLSGWISPMMGLGMILVAACPGGNISNFMSSLGKANIELSVSLTAISTALAVFMTPLNFSLWEVFKTIFILLGIPLVLGILTSKFLPKVANALKKPLQWLSIVIFIAMVVLAFSGNINAFIQCIKYIFVVVLIHNLLALTLGFTTATVAKLPWKDRRTLTIETGIQNSGLGLALMLGTSIFAGFPPHGGMLVITAWWGIWHIISGLTVATIFNRTRKDACA